MTSENYQAEFRKLQEKYLADFPNKLKALDEFLVAKDRTNLAVIYHKLKGNGKTYGFSEVTEIARLADLHHKHDTPNYFKWAELALISLKIIYPFMQKKESIPLDSIPEYVSLKGELK